MMERFRRAPIRLQFIALASIPIPLVLLCVVAILPGPFIFDNGPLDEMLTVRRSQIELIANQISKARDDAEVENLAKSIAYSGMAVEVRPWSDVSSDPNVRQVDDIVPDELRRVLPAGFEAVILDDIPGDERRSAVAVHIDPQRALVISFPSIEVHPLSRYALVEFFAKVAILIAPMLLLVLYMDWMITSPLVRFAGAARSLRLDDSRDEQFPIEGARELRTLATSLNNMRRRIRKMVDDRTRMLTAVSHDLRTPLTRLRMRVERSSDATSKDAMLADISTLTTMIEDSLQYLTSTATVETLRKVDISSLLQTIASEFSDLGHNVVYSGPERFAYWCKRKAMIRAVTNIVENAVRFGTIVRIELRNNSRGDVEIVVCDDGPGLDNDLHERVLEPFFKADDARTTRSGGGFGLGLSIADEIVKGHGGSLLIENASPQGLRVTIRLTSAQVVPHHRIDTSASNGKSLARDVVAGKR